MSVKQINKDQWRLDIRIWKNGVEYRHRENFTGGIKAVRDREYEIKKALRKKADSESGSLKIRTFGEALKFYSDSKTLGTSQSLIDRLIKDLGNVQVTDLLFRFKMWHNEIKKDSSVATGNRYLSWSKAALNYCVSNGLIERNPLGAIKPEKEFPRRQRLSVAQEKKLLEVIWKEAPHIYHVIHYALLVPCRKGELVSMRREWYDMVNNCIRIPEGVTKNDEACIKPVPPEMREYFMNVPVESPFLFYRIDRAGNYVSLGDFKRSWNRCLRLAEIKDFRFHDTRRTAYTDLILKGNHSKIVQKISGHKTDMSRVYLSLEGEEAAKSVKFTDNTGLDTGHLKQASN